MIGGQLFAYPTGFVYVLSNPTMPGLVKIGMTERLIADRACELQSTGVALPFTVEYAMMTSYPKDVEKVTHKILTDHRVAPNREYFRIPISAGRAAVQEAAERVAGIDRWATRGVHDVWCGDRLTLSMQAGQLLMVMYYRDQHALLNNELDILDVWEAHSDRDRLDLMGAARPEHVVGMNDDSPDSWTDPIPHLDSAGRIRNAFINGKDRLLPGEKLLWLSGGPEWQSVRWALFEIGDYCQVVSRTWTPQTATDGAVQMPLLLNMPEHLPDPVTPAMKRAVSNAKARAAVPGTWVPRYSENPHRFGGVPLSSDQWLQGLVPRGRSRRR
ncbi:GIY-YIG nuclease family protein [Nocardia wallacei]|uniref:GIY-YIG nuclease family protein n=1 Tax=Nocardia wallacei TaxID=480035 RepID=UPI0024572458|nr:GIY-YIG nuclease family protein [Nocardia wallacei]